MALRMEANAAVGRGDGRLDFAANPFVPERARPAHVTALPRSPVKSAKRNKKQPKKKKNNNNKAKAKKKRVRFSSPSRSFSPPARRSPPPHRQPDSDLAASTPGRTKAPRRRPRVQEHAADYSADSTMVEHQSHRRDTIPGLKGAHTLVPRLMRSYSIHDSHKARAAMGPGLRAARLMEAKGEVEVRGLYHRVEHRGWAWLVDALSKDREGMPTTDGCKRCLVNVPDVIIVRDLKVAAWYFTARSGHLKRRSPGALSLVKVHDFIGRAANDHAEYLRREAGHKFGLGLNLGSSSNEGTAKPRVGSRSPSPSSSSPPHHKQHQKGGEGRDRGAKAAGSGPASSSSSIIPAKLLSLSNMFSPASAASAKAKAATSPVSAKSAMSHGSAPSSSPSSGGTTHQSPSSGGSFRSASSQQSPQSQQRLRRAATRTSWSGASLPFPTSATSLQTKCCIAVFDDRQRAINHPLTLREFLTNTWNGVPPGLVEVMALPRVVRARYEAQYQIDRRGRHHFAFFKYCQDAPEHNVGVHGDFEAMASASFQQAKAAGLRMVRSMDTKLNADMADEAMSIIRHAEAVRRCKIFRTELSFFMTDDGRIWLCGAGHTQTWAFGKGRPATEEDGGRGSRVGTDTDTDGTDGRSLSSSSSASSASGRHSRHHHHERHRSGHHHPGDFGTSMAMAHMMTPDDAIVAGRDGGRVSLSQTSHHTVLQDALGKVVPHHPGFDPTRPPPVDAAGRKSPPVKQKSLRRKNKKKKAVGSDDESDYDDSDGGGGEQDHQALDDNHWCAGAFCHEQLDIFLAAPAADPTSVVSAAGRAAAAVAAAAAAAAAEAASHAAASTHGHRAFTVTYRMLLKAQSSDMQTKKRVIAKVRAQGHSDVLAEALQARYKDYREHLQQVRRDRRKNELLRRETTAGNHNLTFSRSLGKNEMRAHLMAAKREGEGGGGAGSVVGGGGRLTPIQDGQEEGQEGGQGRHHHEAEEEDLQVRDPLRATALAQQREMEKRVGLRGHDGDGGDGSGGDGDGPASEHVKADKSREHWQHLRRQWRAPPKSSVAALLNETVYVCRTCFILAHALTMEDEDDVIEGPASTWMSPSSSPSKRRSPSPPGRRARPASSPLRRRGAEGEGIQGGREGEVVVVVGSDDDDLDDVGGIFSGDILRRQRGSRRTPVMTPKRKPVNRGTFGTAERRLSQADGRRRNTKESVVGDGGRPKTADATAGRGRQPQRKKKGEGGAAKAARRGAHSIIGADGPQWDEGSLEALTGVKHVHREMPW